MQAVKLLKAALLATMFAAGAVAPAWADRGHGHFGRDYGEHGHGRHGRDYRHGHDYRGWGLGLLAGTAIILAATERRPVYYAAPVYAAPPVYIPPPVVVVQRAPVVAVPPPQAYVEPAWWYYCAPAADYYPYVQTCPAGWTRVSPAPGW